jgi:hypothetical protein
MQRSTKITQKLKIEEYEPHLKPEVNSCSPGGKAVKYFTTTYSFVAEPHRWCNGAVDHGFES